MFICEYCGREIKNKGALVLHEKYCDKNPNKEIFKHNFDTSKLSHSAWNKGKTKDTDERLKIRGEKLHKKYEDKIIVHHFLGKTHSDETKEILSKKRKQWLLENPEKHVWKRHNKFISVPCQKLKEKLKELNIDFVEEYTPFNDYNYSIDIAFPEIKLGIEVNGNQHYDKSGNLKEYYQKRHNIFENRGWRLLEVHYSKCYTSSINTFDDIFNL